MSYKQLMYAAWEAETKAIALAATDEAISEEDMAVLNNGLRSAKHDAVVAGHEELADYNLRAMLQSDNTVRIEFQLKRRVAAKAIRNNPTEFM